MKYQVNIALKLNRKVVARLSQDFRLRDNLKKGDEMKFLLTPEVIPSCEVDIVRRSETNKEGDITLYVDEKAYEKELRDAILEQDDIAFLTSQLEMVGWAVNWYEDEIQAIQHDHKRSALVAELKAKDFKRNIFKSQGLLCAALLPFIAYYYDAISKSGVLPVVGLVGCGAVVTLAAVTLKFMWSKGRTDEALVYVADSILEGNIKKEDYK